MILRTPTSCCPLTLLSWNISNAKPSFSAPKSKIREHESSRLIRLECLDQGTTPMDEARSDPYASPSRDSSCMPEIIALQECPYPSWGDEEFGLSCGYVSMGTALSHCGYVDLLLRNDLARYSRPVKCLQKAGNQTYKLPSVAATILLPNRTRIAVSSSHFAPFKDGATTRASQCQSLMSILAKESDNCILLGDFNMRSAEDATMENLCGGGWADAWKEGGASRKNRFTWDSFANRYHQDAPSFKARFDRCYLRGESLSVSKFSLMGNTPLSKDEGGAGKGDYLSDHFGLVVKMNIAPPTLEEVDLTAESDDKND